MKDLEAMSNLELLQTHGAVIDELRRRKVVKTNNNPVGDYTEWLVCNRLGLEVQGNSKAGFDAVDPQDEGRRYQIKGRRSSGNSVQFSPLRQLKNHEFDFVVAVVFHEDYSIRRAVKIPYKILITAADPKLIRYQAHINGYILILTEKAVEQDGVEDICHLLA